MDASNMLKPALARGELHCVGATPLDEYRKHIEKDAALARRFQPVLVEEPSVEDTISILRGLKEKYELHHGVRITEKEINEYLLRTLKFEQGGVFKGRVTARGVWVRLEKDVAEIIIEREIMGKSHTISMFLRPEFEKQDDDSMLTKVHRSRGRWGRTRIFRGFMLLTNSSFKSLAAEYSEELELLQTMFKNKVRITITEGAIELSPPEL